MHRSQLESAVKRGDVREVRRLLRAGERPSNEPDTPNLLHKAASLGHVEIARMMLRAGLDIHSQTSERGKYTPLHAAATGDHPQMIDFLLGAGADIERQASEGFTPFLSAVLTNSPAAAKRLLERGANIYARGRKKSALEIAKQNDNAPMIAFLTGELEKRKWKGVRRIAAPQAYLLAGGHGNEGLGERAYTIPPKTTLITVSQCGDAIFKNDMYDNLAHMFAPEAGESPEITAERKEFLLNPKDNLFELEMFLEIPRKTIRIHPAGTPCPNLFYNALANMEGADRFLLKSGTYRYPINGPDFFHETENDFERIEYRPNKVTDKVSDEFVKILFKDSVYPTLAVAREIYKGVDYDDKAFGKEIKVHIYDLMRHLGPGTYYFFACRASAEKFPFGKELFARARLNDSYIPYISNIVGAADALKTAIPHTEVDKTVLGKIKMIRKASQELQNVLRKTPPNSAEGRKSRRARRGGGLRRTRKN